MKLKLLFIIACMFISIPVINADYGVTKKEEQLIKEEEKNKSFIEKLEYRLVEKDEPDMIDYSIITTIIFIMVAIITILNKKTYVYFRDRSVFEDITD